METQAKSIPSAEGINYPFFKNLLESQGYIFKGHERPYDKWEDKFGNKISICQPCGILSINDKIFRGLFHSRSRKMSELLIEFLFNKNPTNTNGNHKGNQSPG